MFFIVNKTKQTIIISDLKVTLGPKQAVDLDKIVDRKLSDASTDLKHAKKSGRVDVRMKDGERPPSSARKSAPANNLEGFKKDLISEMKGVLSNQSQPAPSGISKEDLAAFAKEIIKSMPKSETVVIQGEKTVRNDEEVEMDEKMLAEISARAVDEIVKDTELKSIHYKEESQENTILNNVSELEDLLLDE